MRALFFTHSPDNPNGGASRVYHLLAEGFRRRGHEVDLWHQENFRLPNSSLLKRAVERLAMPWWIDRRMKRVAFDHYDVLMTSSGMGARVFRRRSARGRQPLRVNHVHGLALFDHVANEMEGQVGRWPISRSRRFLAGPLELKWDRDGLQAADLTVVQNLRDLDYLEQTMRRVPRVLIPPAVHPELMRASTTIVPLSERDAARILWFGSWEARKGSAHVGAAFRKIRERCAEARMVIGGTGWPAERLRSHFDERDREHVEVLPRISIAEQIEQLNRAAIFLFPSLSEGFGLALPEAMCFGLAAVTTPTGFGADHVTDGVHGRLTYPSASHLSRAVIELIERPSLRTQVGQAGRLLARTFTVDRMVQSYEVAFQRAWMSAPLLAEVASP